MDKEGRIGERRHRRMGMPHDGSATDYANAFSKRTVLNKCNSYILDYLYTRSVLLSHFSVYLGSIQSNGGVSLLYSFLSRISFTKLIHRILHGRVVCCVNVVSSLSIVCVECFDIIGIRLRKQLLGQIY